MIAGTLLDAIEGGNPESPAIICAGGGPQLSRTELRDQCFIFAQAIRRAGIRPGDAVSIAETNTVRTNLLSLI